MKTNVLLAAILMGVLGCETEDATSAVVDNEYASATVTVYRVWWSTTLFRDPVPAGRESEAERSVAASDFAYALLAPGWDPASGAPPARLVAVRSAAALSVARGDTLHIRVSDDAFVGNCAAGKPLSQEDADFITQRIFPGEFAGAVYDARTCSAVAASADGGGD